jgi:hypothetical protein
LNGDYAKLIQALAIRFSDFFQALATGSGLNALVGLGWLFVTLVTLDIGDDAIFFAGLGKALESSFEWFVWFYDYTDHSDPLVLNFA